MIKFVRPAKSLSSVIFVEGFPVEVPVSLPASVVSYWWDGEDLCFEVQHSSEEEMYAWEHSLEYMKELLLPEQVFLIDAHGQTNMGTDIGELISLAEMFPGLDLSDLED